MADGVPDPAGIPDVATIDDTLHRARPANRRTSRVDARRYRTEMLNIAAIKKMAFQSAPAGR